MALTANDVVELVISGQYLGQLIQNRFNFRVATVPGEPNEQTQLDDIADDFYDAFLALAAPLQVTNFVYTQTSIRNLNSTTTPVIQSRSDTGSAGGASMPSFVAASYQARLDTDTIGRGRKSIGGISETLTDGNEPTAAALADFLALEPLLENNQSTPSGGLYFYVIAKYPSPALRPFIPDAARPGDVIFRNFGTQYSRKAGNGA